MLAQEKVRSGGKKRERELETTLERSAKTQDDAVAEEAREPGPEKIPEPKQKSVEMDLDMQRAPVAILESPLCPDATVRSRPCRPEMDGRPDF